MRIKITEERLVDIAKFLLHYDVNRTKEQSEFLVKAIKQILEDQKKAEILDKIKEFVVELDLSDSQKDDYKDLLEK